VDEDPFPEPRRQQQRRRGKSRQPEQGPERGSGRRSERRAEPRPEPGDASAQAAAGSPLSWLDPPADGAGRAAPGSEAPGNEQPRPEPPRPQPPRPEPPRPQPPPRPEPPRYQPARPELPPYEPPGFEPPGRRPERRPPPGRPGQPGQPGQGGAAGRPPGYQPPGYPAGYQQPGYSSAGFPEPVPPPQDEPAEPIGLYSTAPPPTRRTERERRRSRLPGPPRDPGDKSTTEPGLGTAGSGSGSAATAASGAGTPGGGWAREPAGESTREASPAPATTDERPPPGAGGLWLLAAAIVLVLWSVTCLLDLAQPGIAAAAALSPMITVLAIPLVALGVGRRHPIPAAVATLAAALPWVLVASYGAAGPGPTSPAAGAALRIMTVDANGGTADARRIAELARSYAADVVVVTELTSALAHDLTVEGLNAVVTARVVQISADGASGVGIWTRADLKEAKEVDGLSRPAASGILQTPNGPISLLAAHSADSALGRGSDWRGDLQDLPGHVPAGERRIIVGDLGATPWNPAFRNFASDEWNDAADVVGRGLRPTWPSWSVLPISPLDHVLVAGKLGVSGVDTANVQGTDHRALIVTLVIPPA
jgi:endonuclease/exonuclease/phosphatase (EEP) superfamily protein YafD